MNENVFGTAESNPVASGGELVEGRIEDLSDKNRKHDTGQKVSKTKTTDDSSNSADKKEERTETRPQ